MKPLLQLDQLAQTLGTFCETLFYLILKMQLLGGFRMAIRKAYLFKKIWEKV